MNAATTETTTSTDSALTIAERAAAGVSVTIKAAASGRDHTIIDWTYTARIRMYGNELIVWVPENRVIDAEASRALGNATRKAIIEAWMAAGVIGIKVRKTDGHMWKRTGDWYMGHFHTSGRQATFIINQ